jgi:hypothetical protein
LPSFLSWPFLKENDVHDDPDTDNPDNSAKAAINELARGYKKEKSAAKRVLYDGQDAVTQKKQARLPPRPRTPCLSRPPTSKRTLAPA